MDLVDRLSRAILARLGLDDPGAPRLDRLAFYEARVDARADDGSTVDVTPLDDRISPAKGVPMDVGVPGLVAVVSPGATVLVGWKRGKADRMFAKPSWEPGATVTKLVLKADAIYLGDESGAEALVKKSEFVGHTHGPGSFTTPSAGGGGGSVTGVSGGAASITGTTNVQAK